ncbi:MAG TPA: ankyrin repeat domain-containing protein, partial [Verrucomicrobiae bacterium]
MLDNPAYREQVHQLIEALDRDDGETVCKLAHSHPEWHDMKAKDGWRPLHFAALIGNKDVAELLIANGANVNVMADLGW